MQQHYLDRQQEQLRKRLSYQLLLNQYLELLQGLWSSGDPCDVGISDAGGTLNLTCEVMTFNVNQNLEEVISADVTLKPTQSSTGNGMNVGPGLAGP